jgi:hypothetical protein
MIPIENIHAKIDDEDRRRVIKKLVINAFIAVSVPRNEFIDLVRLYHQHGIYWGNQKRNESCICGSGLKYKHCCQKKIMTTNFRALQMDSKFREKYIAYLNLGMSVNEFVGYYIKNNSFNKEDDNGIITEFINIYRR